MSFEETILEHASPTLAGLKPASLFRYRPEDGRGFCLRFKWWREALAGLGLRLVILKGCRRTGAYLLYLYRETALAAALERPEHRSFLLERGYRPWADCRSCLRQLAGRLCLETDFPHEIGVFLGYPLEDVVGFIAHRGRDYTCLGCWKAYGDPQAAGRRFARLRACTNAYKRSYARGTPLLRLIVAA